MERLKFSRRRVRRRVQSLTLKRQELKVWQLQLGDVFDSVEYEIRVKHQKGKNDAHKYLDLPEFSDSSNQSVSEDEQDGHGFLAKKDKTPKKQIAKKQVCKKGKKPPLGQCKPPKKQVQKISDPEGFVNAVKFKEVRCASNHRMESQRGLKADQSASDQVASAYQCSQQANCKARNPTATFSSDKSLKGAQEHSQQQSLKNFEEIKNEHAQLFPNQAHKNAYCNEPHILRKLERDYKQVLNQIGALKKQCAKETPQMRQLKRQAWLIQGTVRDGLNIDLLQQVEAKFAKIDAVPSGYFYPEFFIRKT